MEDKNSMITILSLDFVACWLRYQRKKKTDCSLCLGYSPILPSPSGYFLIIFQDKPGIPKIW